MNIKIFWCNLGQFWRTILRLAICVILTGAAVFLYALLLRYVGQVLSAWTGKYGVPDYKENKNESTVSMVKKETNVANPADAAKFSSNTRSPEHLIKLAKLEEHIFKLIGVYSDEVLQERSRVMDEYLTDYDESSLKATAGLDQLDAAEAISENPILAYRMIRRYAKTLGHLFTSMQANTHWNFLEKLIRDEAGDYNMSEWPTNIDLDDAKDAMVRMHDIYDFELSEFTSGNLMGVQTHVELKASDCQEIGEFATHRLKHYSSGVLWLEAALNKTNKSIEPDKFKAITSSLRNATETHDIAWMNTTYWDYKFFEHSLKKTPVENRKSLRKVHYDERKGFQKKWWYNTLNFWGLCSGNNHQTPEEIADLFCWYETRSNLAWLINPLRVEQLSREPYLIQIYDVLTAKTIQAMKDEVIPRLKRSNVVHSSKAHGTYPSNVRTSVESWVDPNGRTAQNLARYVELMTGLNVVPDDSSEHFLTASYSFGGHYECHLDALQDIHLNYKGNRIATLMFYLDDVEVGGFTAFPNIGTATRPVKGSAVFWYNLHKNGSRHHSTYHGACPVVLGHKWIVTKWIRVNAQMLTRPCGLSFTE